MRGVLAREFLRLWTLRSTWWLSGSSLLASVVLAVAFALTAGGSTAARLQAPPGSAVPGDQESFALVLAAPAQVVTLLMGLLGVFAFGHEYRHGTILPTLTSVPRRGRLAVAKLLGVAAWAAAVGACSVAVSAAVAVALRGGRFDRGVGFADGPTLRVAAGTVLFVVLYALVGVGFGWLLRSVPAGVSVLLVLPIAVEPLLRVILSIDALGGLAGVGRFLPLTAGGQLVAYSTSVDPSIPEAFRNDLSPLTGGLTLTAALAVLLVVAAVLFRRRDA